jgi:hypothetical protein
MTRLEGVQVGKMGMGMAAEESACRCAISSRSLRVLNCVDPKEVEFQRCRSSALSMQHGVVISESNLLLKPSSAPLHPDICNQC